MQKADVKVQIWSRQIHLRLLLQKKKLVSIHPPLSKSHVPVDPLYQPQNMCGPTKSQMKEQVELKINLEKKINLNCHETTASD